MKSVFKDAKRYSDELQLSFQFNKEATVITHDDQVAVVSTKEPKSIKEILRKTTQQKRRTEVMELPWLGEYVSQHWKGAETTPVSYQIFKSRKNIPDIVLSVNTSYKTAVNEYQGVQEAQIITFVFFRFRARVAF